MKFAELTSAARLERLKLVRRSPLATSTNWRLVRSTPDSSSSGVRAASASSLNGRAGSGRVFVVGREPILDGTRVANNQIALVLYAPPGGRYTLEHSTDLADTAAWTFDGFVDTASLKTTLPLRPMSRPVEFFRALLPAAPCSVIGVGSRGPVLK